MNTETSIIENRKEIHDILKAESEKLLALYSELLPENNAKWHAEQYIISAFKWANMTLERT